MSDLKDFDEEFGQYSGHGRARKNMDKMATKIGAVCAYIFPDGGHCKGNAQYSSKFCRHHKPREAA